MPSVEPVCAARSGIRRPSASATASEIRAGSRIGPSSTSQTPSEYSWRSARAASIARLVFPTPPGPVSVTSRCPASERAPAPGRPLGRRSS